MVDKRRDIENEREELISSAKEEIVQLGIKTSDYFHEVDFEFRATLRRFYGARLTYNEAVAGGLPLPSLPRRWRACRPP